MTSLRLRFRPTLLALLGVVALALAPSAAASAPVAFPSAVALPVADITISFFDTPGIGDILDEIRDNANRYRGVFMGWGTGLYVTFFGIQFILLGATMLIKGPFAIATYRPIHALNPFANFFFFLLAGTLGFLFVSNSATTSVVGGTTVYGGWVQWLYDLFQQAGASTGCGAPVENGTVLFTNDIALGLGNPCNEDTMAWIGMRLSGIMTVLAESTGANNANPSAWTSSSGGASMAAFAAFSLIAVQLALTKAAFALAIVTAPLFLATIVFQPMSGISTGYLSFVVYLGVRLFILQIVAGLAGIVADAWISSILSSLAGNLLTGIISGSFTIDAGSLFGFNATVITSSLLFVSLTLYLPTKVASMVSQRLNLDINGILFRGEFPIAIH